MHNIGGVCALFVGFFVLPLTVVCAQSANLSLDPATGVFPVGEPFTIDVRIDTDGQTVSIVDATISYNPTDVQYVAVSGVDSVFSKVIEDPNSGYGKIGVSAVKEQSSGGYIGTDGLVARLTFIPLRNVSTQFHFASGGAQPPYEIGASIGGITNILSGLKAATYSFIPKTSMPASPYFAQASEQFEITPLPVPKSDWFGTTTVKLSWTVPEGATEMRTDVSPNPEKVPETLYQVPVNSKTLTDLENGLQYFLLQFGFDGEWGDVIRYPVRVDLLDPNYVIVKETDRADPSDPRVAFAIEANDEQSGINYFEMSIDGGDSERWEPEGERVYHPEGLSPGEHVLTTEAFDAVGNSTSTDIVFLVKSLESPTLITETVPEGVLTGDTITVKGETYPNAEVTTYISLNDGEADEKVVKSDENGIFTVTVTEGARAGIYTLWFTVTDSRGATSPHSIKRSIEVRQPYIMLFGSIAVTYLSIIVPLIGLIILLVLVLWLGYTWLRGYRSRVRRETNEAFHSTREEFDSLREELIKQIGMLEKANQSRELTREEMRIFTDLSKRLDKIEEHIMQEIEDIETVEGATEEEVKRKRSVEGSFQKYRNKVQGPESPPSSHTIRL
jgi:hypothetical protein